MKIGELAKRSGLSAHTIRYYERIGLLPYADRDQSSQRDYDASILIWIAFLGRLKTTGWVPLPTLQRLPMRIVQRPARDTIGQAVVSACLWFAKLMIVSAYAHRVGS